MDARFGVRVGPWTNLALEAKNLFNAHYSDPVGHAPVRDDVLQDSRSFYLTVKHHAGWLP